MENKTLSQILSSKEFWIGQSVNLLTIGKAVACLVLKINALILSVAFLTTSVSYIDSSGMQMYLLKSTIWMVAIVLLLGVIGELLYSGVMILLDSRRVVKHMWNSISYFAMFMCIYKIYNGINTDVITSSVDELIIAAAIFTISMMIIDVLYKNLPDTYFNIDVENNLKAEVKTLKYAVSDKIIMNVYKTEQSKGSIVAETVEPAKGSNSDEPVKVKTGRTANKKPNNTHRKRKANPEGITKIHDFGHKRPNVKRKSNAKKRVNKMPRKRGPKQLDTPATSIEIEESVVDDSNNSNI